jgi:hypothetical protein
VKPRYFLIPLFSLALSAAPHLLFGPAVVDDAYITFRYAENIAAGKGFVFNPQDGPVQGTSTPLFTLLLAAGRLAGLPCGAATLLLSVLGGALTYTFGTLLLKKALGKLVERQPHFEGSRPRLTFRLLHKGPYSGAEKQSTCSSRNVREGIHQSTLDAPSGSRPDTPGGASPAVGIAAGISWAVLLATLPQWVIVQISGMETMLFVGLAVASLWAVTARRPFLAAAAAGLAVLTRYDGWALAILVFAALAWEWHGRLARESGGRNGKWALFPAVKRPRTDVRHSSFIIHTSSFCLPLALFLFLQLPWVVYALHTFGAYAPHSILTKRVIHSQSFLEGLATHGRYFLGIEDAMPGFPGIFLHQRLAVFALAGLGFLLARRCGWAALLPLWGMASVIGFSLSGINLFKWYFMPALAAYTWMAVWGVWTLCGWIAARWRSRESRPDGAAALPNEPRAVPNDATVLPGSTPVLPRTGSDSAALPGSAAARKGSAFGRMVAWGLPSLAILWMVWGGLGQILPARDIWPKTLSKQEASYLRAADWVRGYGGAPGQSVLVGEVGALSWALPEYRVVDSSGINSRAVYEARLADRLDLEKRAAGGKQALDGNQALGGKQVGAGRNPIPPDGSAAWVWQLLRDRPEWIVSLKRFLHLMEIENMPEFRKSYHLVHTIENPPAQAVLIYQRAAVQEIPKD